MVSEKSRERNQTWMMMQFRENKKRGRMINTDKFLSEFCLWGHVSLRYAKEMLKIFEMRGLIAIHKDRIEVLK